MPEHDDRSGRATTSGARGAAAFRRALAIVAHHAADLIVLADRRGRVVYANPAAALTFGVALEDAVGTDAIAYLHPEDVERVAERFIDLVSRPGESVTDTVRFVSVSQAVRTLEIVSTNLLHDPHVAGVLVNGRDVTERRQLESDLLEQSLHDALTGLPNRVLFTDRAGRLLAQASRNGVEVTVLFVDLDNFKTYNDGMGHPAGDRLLVAVARRMQRALRDQDLLCRFGGDEFVVLVDPKGDADGTVLADRLNDVLRAPFEIDGRLLSVTASIGIATGHDVGVEDLVRDADLAMYRAKEAGKNQSMRFRHEMVDLANERLQLVLDLQRAIDRHEFVVHFQPILELGDATISGVEALVRWQHPERGLLAPAEFIGAAEENGMVTDLGRIVLGAACSQAARWRFADRGLSLSVNLSARQLASAGLLDDVAGALERSGLPASCLVVEVTESTIMLDVAAAGRRLQELRDLGVRIAIDDFGTGYSSLSYLRRLPVDVLKIDRSFVSDLQDSDAAAAIVRSLIVLGRTLGCELIAEGVEKEGELEVLRAQRCSKAQGFLFSRPLAAEQLEALLDQAGPGRPRLEVASDAGS